MEIRIPKFSLVVMIGPTGSGKSNFAAKHFSNTEIIASDACRAMVADDPADQSATVPAFELLHTIAKARLKAGKLTVIDATNLRPEHRGELVEIARNHDCPTYAILMDTPLSTCLARNAGRGERTISEHVVHAHHRQFRRSLRQIRREHIYRHFVVDDEKLDDVTLTRTRTRPDLSENTGPFDIIGDVHGCYDELLDLLSELGYNTQGIPVHPQNRQAVFLGDLVDRGPASDRVLELAMDMTKAGSALCIAGNHENKLMRALRGNPVQVSHGLAGTLEQIGERDSQFREQALQFLSDLTEHYMLDNGRLAVAHAGVLEQYQGRLSGRIKEFCLYGQTTGETDEWGLPERQDWAQDYRGRTAVVYGHTPVSTPRWTNQTINIDTGCVFGGRLTALRYPEREIVSVNARRTYYESARPPQDTGAENQENERTPVPHRTLLIEDVSGAQRVQTGLRGNITIPAVQAAQALEPMSRFTVDPRWLVHLPSTMPPGPTSTLETFLEHPAEVFEQYRHGGVNNLICEEKHMGSRAIIVIGRDPQSVHQRFGILDQNAGICYTRTGRQFFRDPGQETEFLDRVRQAVTNANLWKDLNTDWLIMDAEIMPWSLKATKLLQELYAPTAAAGINTLDRAMALLQQAARRGVADESVTAATQRRQQAALSYRKAYRAYCWKTNSLEGIRVAPFHFLAAEGRLLTQQPHQWHMDTALRLHQADPAIFQQTRYVTVDLEQPLQIQEATEWWMELTSAGGEGMVVKPADFIPNGRNDRVQPAVKVRGQQYLRIIYGPEYDLPGTIDKMRRRGLRGKQQSALREFALGIESLRRFLDNEPLHRVHQPVFAIMALESQPSDPRL